MARKETIKDKFIRYFSLSLSLLILIVLSTMWTPYLTGDYRTLLYLISAPFNITNEFNPFANVGIVLAIFAITEFYLKITGRGFMILAAYLSSAVATYIESVYFYIFSGVPVAGTSIIAFTILFLLIVVIIYDMFKNLDMLSKHLTASSLLRIIFIPLASVFVAWFLIQYLYLFVYNNEAAYRHLYGGIIAVGLTIVMLLLRE